MENFKKLFEEYQEARETWLRAEEQVGAPSNRLRREDACAHKECMMRLAGKAADAFRSLRPHLALSTIGQGAYTTYAVCSSLHREASARYARSRDLTDCYTTNTAMWNELEAAVALLDIVGPMIAQ